MLNKIIKKKKLLFLLMIKKKAIIWSLKNKNSLNQKKVIIYKILKYLLV